MAIEGAKFRAPVEPGVLLTLDVEITQMRGKICKFAGKALVDGKVAAQANFTAMIADPPSVLNASGMAISPAMATIS